MVFLLQDRSVKRRFYIYLLLFNLYVTNFFFTFFFFHIIQSQVEHIQFGKGGSFYYAGQSNEGGGSGSLSPSSASGGVGGPEVVYGYYNISGGSTPSGSSASGGALYGPFVSYGASGGASYGSSGGAGNYQEAISKMQGPNADPNVRDIRESVFVLKYFIVNIYLYFVLSFL